MDEDDDTMAERLAILQIEEANEEQMDVDGHEVTFVTKQDSRKRVVQQQFTPNKQICTK